MIDKQKIKIRKDYGGNNLSDFFDGDELIRIAEIAESSIIKWPLEISDSIDMPIDELAGLRVKLKEFLDEEVY